MYAFIIIYIFKQRATCSIYKQRGKYLFNIHLFPGNNISNGAVDMELDQILVKIKQCKYENKTKEKNQEHFFLHVITMK